MSRENQPGGDRPVRSYVLRSTRMSNLQRRSYRELLPRYSIPFRGETIDPKVVFPDAEKIVAEIGFGMGEATIAMALANPKTGYLGIEVHKPGVGKVLSEIDTQKIENLKVINHDAVEVFQTMLPHASLDGIHIFFPDPWPKKKHHKRRLIQTSFIELVLPRLKEGGYLYCCTDWEEYAQEMLEVCSSTKGLRNNYAGFAEAQKWRPRTKFESKGIDKAHTIRELLFSKSP